MHAIFRGVFASDDRTSSSSVGGATGDWREDKTHEPATIARFYAGEKKHADNPSHI